MIFLQSCVRRITGITVGSGWSWELLKHNPALVRMYLYVDGDDDDFVDLDVVIAVPHSQYCFVLPAMQVLTTGALPWLLRVRHLPSITDTIEWLLSKNANAIFASQLECLTPGLGKTLQPKFVATAALSAVEHPLISQHPLPLAADFAVVQAPLPSSVNIHFCPGFVVSHFLAEKGPEIHQQQVKTRAKLGQELQANTR